MKKNLLLALIAIFTLGYYNVANAQSFGIYGGVSLPMGDFADDSGDKAGLAKLGFGGGLQVTFPLGSQGLELIGDAAFLYNPLDEDKSGIKDAAYTNIPVMAGLRYVGTINPDFSIYAMGLAGINIASFSDIEIQNADGYGSPGKITFDSATSFGFGFGAGVIFSESFNIGAKYLILGEPEYKGKLTVEGYTGSADFNIKQSVSMIVITAGFVF
ncbi:MAG: porin family protein [Chlorobiales bacterium]|nr:porin family protein [Chlorobiales bacterium]